MISSTASTRPPAPASRASNISAPTTIAPEVVAARLKKNGLTQVLFNLPPGDWGKGERGIAVLPDRIDEFRSGVDTAITYAKALGCPQVNCLAGIAPAGRRPRRAGERLRRESEICARRRLEEAGIKLLIEAINTRDIPGFFLNTSKQALGDHRPRRLGQSLLSVRHLPHADHGGRSRPHHRGTTSAASRISSLRTIPAVTSRGRARSTIPSSTSISTASATPAGSAPNTSRRPAPTRGWAGSKGGEA